MVVVGFVVVVVVVVVVVFADDCLRVVDKITNFKCLRVVMFALHVKRLPR